MNIQDTPNNVQLGGPTGDMEAGSVRVWATAVPLAFLLIRI